MEHFIEFVQIKISNPCKKHPKVLYIDITLEDKRLRTPPMKTDPINIEDLNRSLDNIIKIESSDDEANKTKVERPIDGNYSGVVEGKIHAKGRKSKLWPTETVKFLLDSLIELEGKSELMKNKVETITPLINVKFNRPYTTTQVERKVHALCKEYKAHLDQ